MRRRWLQICWFIFGICFSTAVLAEAQMPRSEQEQMQMRREMEKRAEERLKGKAFHDATVVSREEVLKFQALRDRQQEEHNQLLRQEMAQPPTSFPFYAVSATSGGHLPERTASSAGGSPGTATRGMRLGISALTGIIIVWWILSRRQRAVASDKKG